MRAGPLCHWCEDEDFTKGGKLVRARCDVITALQSQCQKIKYLNSSTSVQDSEDFASTIQVRPQKIKLALRTGQTESFKVTVKPAEDFPVDIYFLNDLSRSMERDLKNLQILADSLAEAIKNITKNYRLGFGAFIDKPTQPFAFYPEDFPDFPCNRLTSCTFKPMFGYAHLFDFNSNTTEFSNAIAAAKTSADIGDAEGCFDGLMQVVSCEEQIKWKPKKSARRLVILVTDAEPKLAGDGRIANIIEPNDGKCYLKKRIVNNNTELYYYRSTELDYPSISQLRRVMKEKDIAPILAVDPRFLDMYKVIAKEWADLGSAAAPLTENSVNIVNLVRDNYNRVATTIALTDEAPPYLELIYQVDGTTCTPPAKVLSNSVCSDVKLNQTVVFDVKARLKFCPNPLPKDPSVTIRIAGFGEVTIDVEYLCQCNCLAELKSPKCNNVGTYKCGICECDQGYSGYTCQCDVNSPQNDTTACVDPNSAKTLCNGDGACICGQCECFAQESPKVVTGQYCQCKNFGCPKVNPSDTEECGGPSNGKCECGQCKCIEPYTGINCGQIQCSILMNRTCQQNGVECNGNGKCENCENCRCNPGFAGLYCDECITQDCQCSKVDSSCLSCHLKNETCPEEKNCSMHEFIKVPNNVTFDVSCFVRFGQCSTRYNYTGLNMHNTTMVWTYHEKNQCVLPLVGEDETDTLALIIGIIAAILILGLLLLLLWKLLVTLHDKKEYAKFERAANDSRWEKDGNPIYRDPNQQFVNPAFAGEL